MGYAEEVNGKFKNGENYPLRPTDMRNVVLRLETTSVCNHACVFCPNHKQKRRRKFIEKDIARKVILEAAKMGVRNGGFFIMGEPLLCPDTLEYYRYAKEAGYDFLFLTTNGSLATEDKIREIFASGIKSLKFSINGGSAETYRKMHGRDDYEKAMSALRYAYEYRNKNNIDCRILSSYIVTKENVNEIKTHYENIKKYVDDFAFFGMATFASTVLKEVNGLKTDFDSEDISHVEFSNSCPCSLLVNSINVTSDGYLTLCVTSPTSLAAVEDLHYMSLKDAWYSKRMVEIRRMHLEGRLSGILCNNCINKKTDKVTPVNEELYYDDII